MLSVELQEKNAKDLIARANRKIGIGLGMEKHLITQVCKKLRKGKNAATIAMELDEDDSSKIEKICEAAKDFAPDYDVDAIFELLCDPSQYEDE